MPKPNTQSKLGKTNAWSFTVYYNIWKYYSTTKHFEVGDNNELFALCDWKKKM